MARLQGITDHRYISRNIEPVTSRRTIDSAAVGIDEMDSFELTKIAGAVLAALLTIIGFNTAVDMRSGGHGSPFAGYTLPEPAAEAPAAKAAEKAPAPAALAVDKAAPADKKSADATAAPAPAPKTDAPPNKDAAAPAEEAAPAAAGGFDAAKVVSMIGAANADNGKALFRKCAACHSYDATSPSKLGPNLWNIVDRNKAAREDFSGYSPALKAKGGDWTFEDLAHFTHSPKDWLPGTKMIFPGIAEPGDVADLLAYVRTLADTPAPLPQ